MAGLVDCMASTQHGSQEQQTPKQKETLPAWATGRVFRVSPTPARACPGRSL